MKANKMRFQKAMLGCFSAASLFACSQVSLADLSQPFSIIYGAYGEQDNPLYLSNHDDAVKWIGARVKVEM